MRVIRTEHLSFYDSRLKYRYVDTPLPHPDAILRWMTWPQDPIVQPVLLTWVVLDPAEQQQDQHDDQDHE